MNRRSRSEFHHIGLQIDDGRSIYGIQSLDLHGEIVNGNNAANRRAQPIGAILRSLGEDPDRGPVLSAARMAGVGTNGCFVDAVENEQHFNMGKRIEPRKTVGSESRGVQLNS